MTLEAVLTLLAQAIYLWVAGDTLLLWLRQRDKSRLDIFLVFLSLAIAIAAQDLSRLRPSLASPAAYIFFLALLAQPYLVLRVAAYSLPVGSRVRYVALAGLLLSYASLFFLPLAPTLVTSLLVGYFVVLETYDAALLERGASGVQGIYGRRLRLAAIGSGLLVLLFILALGVLLLSAASLIPASSQAELGPLTQFLGILSGLAYYLGFAPPRWLRRTWQFRELYDFLRHTSTSANEPPAAFSHLPSAAARSVAALGAAIARPDPDGHSLAFETPGQPLLQVEDLQPGAVQAGEVAEAWYARRPRLVRLPGRISPSLAAWAASFQAQALYLVPVVGSVRPWGLLVLALRHIPLFASDDLDLLALLSEQSVTQLDYAALVDKLQNTNESLQRRITEQARSEEKFRELLESAPDAMVIVDEQGIIQLINSQTEKMFGYNRAELIGQSVELLVPKRFQKKHVRHREGYNVDHPARPMGIGLELFGVRKNGTEFPVEISLSPLEIESTLLINAAIRDVTQRKRIEEEIQKLNSDLEQRAAQLEAANKELESFSYSVSHDLRAPLRSIDGFSQALLEDYGSQLAPEGRNYLERVRAAAQRMAQLIDDLLNLSRVTRASLNPRFINLSSMAQEIIDSLREQDPDRKVRVSIMPDLMVTADPHLMRIALDNLLNNAWKFTSRREQALIEFGQQNKTKERTFFVRDNGVGFDMAYMDKLFGVFQRLHSASEYPGTGVGLATVQRIIKIHGGRIWAESTEGEGTTFYFTL